MASVIWALIGLVLIVSEFVVPGFVIFFFGAGALLNALLVALVPGIAGNIIAQILIWLGFSSVTLFGLRRYFAKWFRGRTFDEEDRAEYIGKEAKVTETIGPDKPGRIRFNGTTWVAESYSESFSPGQRVEIIKREGTRFIVTESIMGIAERLADEDEPTSSNE
jgi:membrane protein implicated in regulation of membrane protease activity